MLRTTATWHAGEMPARSCCSAGGPTHTGGEPVGRPQRRLAHLLYPRDDARTANAQRWKQACPQRRRRGHEPLARPGGGQRLWKRRHHRRLERSGLLQKVLPAEHGRTHATCGLTAEMCTRCLTVSTRACCMVPGAGKRQTKTTACRTTLCPLSCNDCKLHLIRDMHGRLLRAPGGCVGGGS
jgi:hypothetical protein